MKPHPSWPKNWSKQRVLNPITHHASRITRHATRNTQHDLPFSQKSSFPTTAPPRWKSLSSSHTNTRVELAGAGNQNFFHSKVHIMGTQSEPSRWDISSCFIRRTQVCCSRPTRSQLLIVTVAHTIARSPSAPMHANIANAIGNAWTIWKKNSRAGRRRQILTPH